METAQQTSINGVDAPLLPCTLQARLVCPWEWRPIPLPYLTQLSWHILLDCDKLSA
jgi:hypothetical protein